MSDWVDWFPIVMLPLKIIILGVCMFFAIKWHYDQDKIKKREASEQQAAAQHATDVSD